MFLLLLACLLFAHEARSRTVEYTFNVSYFEKDPDRRGPAWVQGINGAVPGPEVRVRRHDRLRVTVNNQLATEPVSLHWHGFEMRDAQEYDGAVGVTQCGILPGTSFTYDFIVDEHPGSYMYHGHADVGRVAARGMFGSLVVEPEDGSTGLWQYDREATLLLTDWWPDPAHELERRKQGQLSRPGAVSALGTKVVVFPFHNLLINGKGAFNVFGGMPQLAPGHVSVETHVSELAHVAPAAGETWRMRISNAGAAFAVRFRIDGHKLQLIQADGSDIERETVDAITMSPGERFDALVTFSQPPGSYWMRAETLEDGPSLHHGQLGVLRYQGAPEGALPTMGFPQAHKIHDSTDLVTMNCFDQAAISDTCRSITDLRRHPSMRTAAGTAADPTHDFEVSFRGFTGESDSHFTRVIDLTRDGNTIGANQHGGDYVQFSPPLVPYSHVNASDAGQHKNTLTMHVSGGEYVRVVLQIQDKAGYPWHMHGHKFAVLGVGFPDYSTQCHVLYCRSDRNHWLSRDGFPSLLDPDLAPLKDTVYVPAGGWAVIQFKADNPGWWLFHCNVAAPFLDGLGLVLVEAPEYVPPRLTNSTYLEGRGIPACHHELEDLRRKGNGLSCSCWQSPEMRLDNLPRSSYRCSRPYLCGDQILSDVEPQEHWQRGKRSRAGGRGWRGGMLAAWIGVVIALFLSKWLARRQVWARADVLAEMVEDLRRGHGDKLHELVKRVKDSGRLTSTTSAASQGSLAPRGGIPRDMPGGLDSERSQSGKPASPRESARSSADGQVWRSDEPEQPGPGQCPGGGACSGAGCPMCLLDEECAGCSGSVDGSGSGCWMCQGGTLSGGGPEERLGGPSTRRSRPKSTMGAIAEQGAPRTRTDSEELDRTASLNTEGGRRTSNPTEGSQRGDTKDTQLSAVRICTKDTEFSAARTGRSSDPGRCSVTEDGQLLTCLPTVGLRLRFRAQALAANAAGQAPCIVGTLRPGSVVALLGRARSTDPWLLFFAGRRQRDDLRVTGSLQLGDECVARWGQQALRQARGYISSVQTLRPTCSVGDFLALPLLLTRAPDLYESNHGRTLHMVKFVALFKLEAYLSRSMGSLDDETLLKVLIAQETVLPRGVLIIRDPLRGLMPTAATRMMKVFKLLADKLKVTIIFSCDGWIPRDASRIVTHAMMLGESFKPFFASRDELPGMLGGVGLSVPPGTDVVEWASEISMKALTAETRKRKAKGPTPILAEVMTVLFRGSGRSGSDADDAGYGAARHSSKSSASSKLGIGSATLRALFRKAGSLLAGEDQKRFSMRKQECFLSQLRTLLQYQMIGNLEDSITIYRLFETFGIAISAGLVWYQKGSESTQSSLGETIGLFFFTTALYTVPPVFQVLAVAPSEAKRITLEHMGGMYPLYIYVISMTISSFLTVVVWAPVWQVVSYFLADLGPSPSAMLAMQLTLMLNVLAMRTVGYSLAMIVPSAALNVVIANLFAQLCMLTNGFYTKLQPWLQWVTVVSVPRFTFRALLKLEYSWRDTFEVHPMYGFAGLGNPTRYIPAELTGTFQLMADRQMDVMESPEDSSPLFEMTVMAGISLAFNLLFLLALVRRVRELEERPCESCDVEEPPPVK